MTEEKFCSPLKIGLLIVTLSYFLFALHSTFTLSWIGEWNTSRGFNFYVFITDISGAIGLPFRLAAGLIAFGSVIFYFNKGFPSTAKTYKILRWILVLEGIYWLSLLTTAATNVYSQVTSDVALNTALTTLAISTIPSLVESLLIPIVLFVLAWKLNPDKPAGDAIKWALITGVSYVLVFWLTNMGMWFTTILYEKGRSYLTTYPENMLNFVLTTFGMLALTIYTGYFTKKSVGAQSLQELNLKVAGVIITLLGLFFLWNYLTWIFFGGNYLWSYWFAWFLGHNLDLWMLSLPMLGIPLLFTNKPTEKHSSA
jgi:hypothetical protein